MSKCTCLGSRGSLKYVKRLNGKQVTQNARLDCRRSNGHCNKCVKMQFLIAVFRSVLSETRNLKLLRSTNIKTKVTKATFVEEKSFEQEDHDDP